MNNKPLHIFVGPSASGKTSVADALEKYGRYKQLKSYTTRPPRYEGEIGHIFITKEEFDKLETKIAYTEYNGHYYCATKQQLDEVDIYVVDVPGIKTLIENYDTERIINILYFDVELITRVKNMVSRGDSDAAIVNRILTDEAYDWYDALITLRDYAELFTNHKVNLHRIDANISLDDLIKEVMMRI